MTASNRQYVFRGFGIKGYRSFSSDEAALVGPFNKVHLITGQNNTGKSALADIACRILPAIQANGSINGKEYPFSESDNPQGRSWTSDSNITLSLCFSLDAILAKLNNVQRIGTSAKRTLENAFSSQLLSRDNKGICWFDFDIPLRPQSSFQHDLVLNKEFADSLSEECSTNFQDAALAITSHAGSNPRDNLNSIVRSLIPWESIPRAIKVDAIRKITSNVESISIDISGGEGLIRKLRQLKLPSVKEQFANQEKWGKFERFVRNILNDQDAEVTTDAEAKSVLVKSGTPGFLELQDLGTGIEEIVMIAAVAACNNNKLILIEEPEIHLHPTLQAKLVQYFQNDKNGNRFLITTHSPSIINTSGVTITQVSKANGLSTSSQVRGLTEARNVLDDIGARPSDLLQSNYVIWVEGPSDRIYLNYWLSVTDPTLKEGTHYSIMIYGGRLLNACEAKVPEGKDELISLFRVNTHFCVLMDSDRPKKGARLNNTKLRIKSECESSGNLSWVTDGRTIENYIPEEVLRQALSDLYPNKKYKWEMNDQYVCPLDGKFCGVQYKPDKILTAKRVVQIGHEMHPSLQKQLEKLCDRIKTANGL